MEAVQLTEYNATSDCPADNTYIRSIYTKCFLAQISHMPDSPAELWSFPKGIQSRLCAEIHGAIGDSGCGECLFAQLHTGQHLKFLAGCENDDFALLADAIQSSIDPKR